MLIGFPAHAAPADEVQQKVLDEMDSTIDSLDLAQWQAQMDQWAGESGETFSIRQILRRMANGEAVFDSGAVFQRILEWLGAGFSARKALLAQLLALIVVAALCERVIEPLEEGGVSQAAVLVVYAAAALVVINVLKTTLSELSVALSRINTVMEAVFPLLSTLLALSGGYASAAVLQPVYSLALQGSGVLTRNILMPLSLMAGALSVAGHLFSKDALDELAGSIRSGCVWCIGIVLTVLAAMSGMQSMLSASYDGVSLQAAKFAVDNAVPYVGGMLSDMTDSLLGGALIIKNALGVTTLLSVILLAGGPIFNALLSYFLLRITASAASLFQSRICGLLKAAAGTVMVLLALLLAAAAMLLLIMAITIQTGGEILSLR